MKKVAHTLLLVLVLVSFSVTAHADAVVGTGAQGMVTPQFVNISFLNPSFSVNASGQATCRGSVSLYSSSQTVELTVTLQKLNTDGWIALTAWTDSGPGVPGVSLEHQYYVVKGTYRVCITARVYSASGALLETASAYSSVITY